jgi:sugar O-acyltransferase (sialic acid O-acetyltransferase NeuD family)
MQNKNIYVIGAGGHGKVIISTLKKLGLNVTAIFDDDLSKKGKQILDVPILGAISAALPEDGRYVIAIGDNKKRKNISGFLKDKEFISVIHPDTFVDFSAQIGIGTVIFAGAVVQVDSIIGDNVILNTSCTVDHDCIIGDYCHIAPGVNIAGGVRVGEGAFIGIGSCIIPNVKIGEWSQVGAGSVVVNDIPAGVLAYGNPAKVIREINNGEK